jgi:hypothetical protein
LAKSEDVFDRNILKRKIEQKARDDEKGLKAVKTSKNNTPGQQSRVGNNIAVNKENKKLKLAPEGGAVVADSLLVAGSRTNTNSNNTNDGILSSNNSNLDILEDVDFDMPVDDQNEGELGAEKVEWQKDKFEEEDKDDDDDDCY